VLQVVSLLAPDAPLDHHTDAMRDAKVQVFDAMRPIAPHDTVRGQFRGYRGEAGVAADSQTETFVAFTLHIDNERWTGVPFYIRAGKQMPVTGTEILVRLKPSTLPVFDAAAASNYFRFRINPDVLICLGTRVKMPGEAMVGESVELVAHQHAGDGMPPYERLLGDALRGDSSLFARYDSIEAAWRVVTPILGNTVPLKLYESQTWGPPEAANLVGSIDGWHEVPAQENQ
jgi:glucose-6-phosphate 1-dehydrogenase